MVGSNSAFAQEIRFMKSIIASGISLMALSAVAVSLQLHSPIGTAFAPSATAGGASALPVISPDGRFVLFASTAGNLALATNNLPYRCPGFQCYNVFLRDRASNTTVLVSISADGTAGADQNAFPAGISTNGQFALFESTADNLAPASTNLFNTVFVRDVLNGITYVISANSNGVSGNSDAYDSVLTPDGSYVAFTSAASNLVAAASNGIPNVFIRNVPAGTISLVSLGAKSASATGDETSDSPAITPDGRYVAFYSSATNLVPGTTNAGDIYLRDLTAGTITWISAQARSQFHALTGNSSSVSCDPLVSDDGNYVAFMTCINSANGAYGTGGGVFRWNRASGQLDLAGTNVFAPFGAYESYDKLKLTPDGRFIAYIGNVGGATGATNAIYLWDGQTGDTVLISADTNNTLPAAGLCDLPQVSADGSRVAFLSNANLATNPADSDWHVYLRDVAAASTSLVDVDTNGYGPGDSSVLDVCLSADGSLVGFDSTLSSLAGNDRNLDFDTFFRNAAAGTTELISVRQPLLPCISGDNLSSVATQPLSQDGHFLAFDSYADDLVAGVTNQLACVYARDLYAGTTVLASVGLGGTNASGSSYEAAISGNGRYVAFASTATNLVAGYTNAAADVYVRDLQANTTTLISVNASGKGGGNGDSDTPTISYDGSYVLFYSEANNLAAGSFGTYNENLFLRDVHAGVTYALTTAGLNYGAGAMTPDGHYIAYAAGGTGTPVKVWDTQLAQCVATNNALLSIYSLSISPDGNRVAAEGGIGAPYALHLFDRAANTNWVAASDFAKIHGGLTFSADGNWLAYAASPGPSAVSQTYLYNVPGQTSTLISHGAGLSVLGNGASDSACLSADGRFVVYRSAANNLVADDTNGVADIFLYDTTTGSNMLLTASLYGASTANNFSESPVFSGDGRTLVFNSLAGDLVAGDYNQEEDVFAYALLYANVSADNSGNVTVDWPTAPGQSFTVQYTEGLGVPAWQTCTGTIITNGNRAHLTDPMGNSQSRFYRVVSDKW